MDTHLRTPRFRADAGRFSIAVTVAVAALALALGAGACSKAAEAPAPEAAYGFEASRKTAESAPTLAAVRDGAKPASPATEPAPPPTTGKER